MNLLIVEGNILATREEREAFGIRAYHLLFKEMLHFLVPDARMDVAFPADGTHGLPALDQIKTYDGVLWTGSSLSVTEKTPPVTRQLDFAATLFESGTPIYGSCWGLQVATVVAGGVVVQGDKGLEFGITGPISLTEPGRESPFFQQRIAPYSALCIHYDEVVQLPKDAVVLAQNAHSKVQALVFDYKNTSFFGVQYHPEFRPSDLALIASFLSEKLIAIGRFISKAEVAEFVNGVSEQTGLPYEIRDYKLHTQEIAAWLRYIAVKKKNKR